MRREPVDDRTLRLAERRALQRLERHDATFGFLQLTMCAARGFREFALACAFSLQRATECRDALACSLDGRSCVGFGALDIREPARDVGGRERFLLLRRAFALRREAPQLTVEFPESRALGFGR
jgi:hypothetical protein